jgi:hypothetical protein
VWRFLQGKHSLRSLSRHTRRSSARSIALRVVEKGSDDL